MDSVWMDVSLPRFDALRGDIRTDVLIIGGGMAGLLTAHALQSAGISCVVAEADRIGMGITKNTTAKITSQHGLCYHKLLSRFGEEKAGLYLQANQEAVAAFRVMCAGMDCDFREEDNFIFSRADRTALEQEILALEALDFSAELTEELPLPFPTAGAVKFPRQAQFHPLKFLSSLAKDLNIYENTPVRQLKKTTALCDHGTVSAEAVVVATHFPFLNKHGSYFLKLYQQRSYAIALEGLSQWQGMYLEEQENGLSFRSHNGIQILGGGGHRTGREGGGWQELEDFAALYYPEARITRRWATQDCMSLDGIPYIGRYSAGTRNLYVATGFSKWGMTSSMVSARLLTDLLTGRASPYAGVFSPSRSMLHPQLGLNAVESAKNLLMPSVPRCPHLGCALKWNRQERSWDCPCHGSRFEADGRLIDNPATGDLKKRD